MLGFSVLCLYFTLLCAQAYDNAIRSRWKRRTSIGSTRFSLSESVGKIDWDTFLRVVGENPSHGAGGDASASTTASAVSTSSTWGVQPAVSYTGPAQIQCWSCWEFGHAKPNCPLLHKQPKKGAGKAGQPAAQPDVAMVTYPAITNGGQGDGGKGTGKGDGKGGKGKKGKKGDKLANNVAAVFARPR